jgi:hypothetical protein
VTEQSNENERTEDEEADVGFVGGGGPAATIDDDDDTLDEHGENLRGGDPGER